MATTTVTPANSPDNNATVTSGNTLDVQSGGVANTTTVNNGGTLEVDAGGSETNATIQPGGTETLAGTINGSNVVTATASSTGDLDYGTINVSSGGSVSNVTVESGGLLALTLKSASVNGATVLAGGLLTINGNAPANNVTLQGGTLELVSPKADTLNTTAGQPTASGNLTFASGYNSRLQIDVAQTGGNGTTFQQPIAGYAAGDIVDLRSATFAGATIAQTQNGTTTNVTVSGGSSSGSETFAFTNTTSGGFSLASDGNGATPGTEILYAAPACYVSGTLIRTARGDIAVEHLAVGDLAVTSSGEHRPIRWLGHQTYRCNGAVEPRSIWPVRVAAGAFGALRPSSDLFLSPGHSVCLTLIDEVLVPVQELINGSSIAYVAMDEVTYWHVELESHDILIANDMPAESFLEMGANRAAFENGSGLGDPSAEVIGRTHADFCRRFVDSGPLLAVMRDELRLRAERLGWAASSDLAMTCYADDRPIKPSIRNGEAMFAVPAGVALRIETDVTLPALLGEADARGLGIAVYAISVTAASGEEHMLDLDDPVVAVCFHSGERDADLHYRWSNGAIALPADLTASLEGPVLMRVSFEASTVRGWIAPEPVRGRARLRVAA